MEATAEQAVEKAHGEIWRRFIDRHNVMLDFTELDGSVSIPTPEECRAGMPNALGWWSPIENGAMFNGLYMEGMINRWRLTRAQADREKARRLAAGLMFLSGLSEVRGFIGRGVATDGKAHYPMGSNDQTMPWLYGLWRYAQSGIPDAAERGRIETRMVEVMEVIHGSNWRIPAEPPFNFRGDFGMITWEGAPRMLFVLKAMQQLTSDAKWGRLYQDALREGPSDGGNNRLSVCERGMVFQERHRHSWTGSVATAALRGLWEMEQDEQLREAYARGLRASAALAAEGLPLCRQFDNDDRRKFDGDWRKLNQWWKPQQTEQEAVALAERQSRELNRLSPCRPYELTFVREPLFAAWVVTLCPDRAVVGQHRSAVVEAISHYRYERLHYSFFAAESAWYRLSMADQR